MVPDVWQVLDKIKTFTDKVRNGTWLGATGKPLTDVVAIGIGGSFLGPLFVHTALRTEQTAAEEVGPLCRLLSNAMPMASSRPLAFCHCLDVTRSSLIASLVKAAHDVLPDG